MALVKQFIEKTRDRLTLHKAIPATIYVQTVDGRKLLQIDTHGSEDREIPGKVSQSLQLDEDAARHLLAILKREFE